MQEISPGLFEESAANLIKVLDKSFATKPFQVLVADEISSQTTRILDLHVLGDWCRSKGVVLVIDGTQQFDFTGPKDQLKARLDNADYYIVSTHKWLGNIKTCGVVRLGAGNDGEAPRLLCPNGVSFGWNKNLWDSKADTSNAFTWTGMSDVYVAYIVLEKALRYYKIYGQ